MWVSLPFWWLCRTASWIIFARIKGCLHNRRAYRRTQRRKWKKEPGKGKWNAKRGDAKIRSEELTAGFWDLAVECVPSLSKHEVKAWQFPAQETQQTRRRLDETSTTKACKANAITRNIIMRGGAGRQNFTCKSWNEVPTRTLNFAGV